MALFLGAGASAFASQPTTREIMKLVKDHVQKNEDYPYRDDVIQNYIMRVVNDDAYGDVEELYDGIDQTINFNTNRNCKPIIANMEDHRYRINHARITTEMIALRSIIRKILRASFAINSDTNKSIKSVYDMIWSLIKDTRTKEFQVFTTNYDLVMETYAEEAGFEVINGFKPYRYRSGVWTNTWDQNTDYPPLYLVKMHGSIYWYRDVDGKIVETGSVAEVDADSDIMIAPTLGAKDYNKEPFSSLIDRFKMAIREVDVLLVIGFSYRDDMIVEIIRDRLKNGMALISISLDAATSIRHVSDADIREIVVYNHHLKAIGSQIILYEQNFGLDTIDDIHAALDAAYVFIRFSSMRARNKNIENDAS